MFVRFFRNLGWRMSCSFKWCYSNLSIWEGRLQTIVFHSKFENRNVLSNVNFDQEYDRLILFCSCFDELDEKVSIEMGKCWCRRMRRWQQLLSDILKTRYSGNHNESVNTSELDRTISIPNLLRIEDYFGNSENWGGLGFANDLNGQTSSWRWIQRNDMPSIVQFDMFFENGSVTRWPTNFYR